MIKSVLQVLRHLSCVYVCFVVIIAIIIVVIIYIVIVNFPVHCRKFITRIGGKKKKTVKEQGKGII